MSLSELKELFLEIGDYLYNRYLCIDLSQYNNFSLGATNTLIPQIIICFIIGAMIASVFMYLEKSQATNLINALLQAKCKDESNAKTPTDLNVCMTRSLISRMRKPSPLSKLVYYRGQKIPVSSSFLLQETDKLPEDQKNSDPLSQDMGENGNKEQSFYATRAEMIRERNLLDFQNLPLYIPEKLSYRAEVRYGKKPSRLALVFSLIALPILGIVILRGLPSVLLLADGLITFFK